MKIAGSFLSIDNHVREGIEVLDKTSISYIHLDIMDGSFVPNLTYSFNEAKYLVDGIKKPLDVHLMVNDVFNFALNFSLLGPEYITFHYEVCDDVMDDMIDYIKSLNCKVGVSIKPDTGVSVLAPYLNKIDLVLVMSVEPGFGGQKFVDFSIDKVNELYELRNEHNYHYVIEVDGGINSDNIKLLNKADICVVGSFITNSDDYEERVNGLLGKIN